MENLQRLSQVSIVFIGIAVLCAVLSVTASIAAPMALALVAGVVLSPASDFFERRGLSPALAALLILFLALCLLSVLALLLQPLVQDLVAQAPKVWRDLQGLISTARSLLKGLSEVAKEVTDAVAQPARAAPSAPAALPGLPVETITGALMVAPSIFAQLMIFAGALFFFLMTRAEVYSWAAIRFASPTMRGPLVQRLRAAEGRVSTYFLTITLINAGLGLATGIALEVLGLPGAPMWGFMAFLLNFVPYLGPVSLIAALVFSGVASFDGVKSALPALSFLAFNFLEGQFITPTLLGRSLSINPLLVFVSLIFGIWLWGPLGGIVAIPILLWILVLNDLLKDPKAATAPAAAAIA